MLGTLALLSFPVNASANTPTIAPELSLDQLVTPTLDDAVRAYESGDIAGALALAKIIGNPNLENDPQAQVMVGHILLRGETGIVNETEAAKWYKLAAAQKDADAQMALGEMAVRSQAGMMPKEGLAWFSAASQTGRLDAKRAIGEMYIKGQGILPDIAKGRTWLEEAALMGDGIAARKLADTYFEKDAQTALKWYNIAADRGGVDSAYIAAIMYAENLNVKPNSGRMTELLRQAAEGGHAAAQADYGLLVYQGAGVAQSTEDAASWFEKSAVGGDPEGQFLYAFTLAKGEGVAQSFEDAYYWLLKSGESDVKDYQKDRQALKERLEANVDPTVLDKARSRVEK